MRAVLAWLFLPILAFTIGKSESKQTLIKPLWFAITFSDSSDLEKLIPIVPQKDMPQPAILEGALLLRSETGREARIYFDEGVRKNIHAQYRFRVDWVGKKSSFTILLRTNTAKKMNDGISLRFRQSAKSNSILLDVIDNRIKQVRKTVRIGKPDELWHVCEISLVAGRCLVNMDNTPMLKVSNLTISTGGMGVIVNQGTNLWLDDLVVVGEQ